MNYQKAIDILTSQGKFHINLGLERIEKILSLLNDPQDNLKCIHVAGTNGKGSVCAMLSAILKNVFSHSPSPLREESSGGGGKTPIRVGLFTSPHVFEYTERIKINDVEIEKEIFAQKIFKIVDLADKNEISLTEFEIITAVAFDYFAENNADIVILETGLGGRLDSTNIIKKNICSVITNIDFDHTDRLGDSIEKIAAEKAGIIKKNCPVVIGENNRGINVIKNKAKEKKSQIIKTKPHFKQENIIDFVALKGTYQKENIGLVLAAIDVLNKKGFEITQEIIKKGLKEVKHPCRFELINKNFIIDGAHNPNGTKALRESLDFYYPDSSFRFIFGCLNNKDYTQMMKNLFTEKDEVYFYEFKSKNACTVKELSNSCLFKSKKFKEYKKGDNTITVICGSFYMIKELLEKMGIK